MVLIFRFVQGQTTVFVNQNAIGKNDGTSWQDAFKTISEALKIKKSDTIKIMMGVYYASSTNDPNESLDLSNTEVIIGGYGAIGNEIKYDPILFPTVISGDIGTAKDTTDNSYQLMQCKKTGGKIWIEGLQFEESNGINAQFPKNKGGAIWIDSNNAIANLEVIIRNCKFTKNRSQTGGAIYFNENINDFSIIPRIEYCTFDKNISRFVGGGAIYIPYIIKSDNDSLSIKKSGFINNYSGENGGAIVFKEIKGKYIIDSTDFFNNFCFGDGASIFQGLSIYVSGSLNIKNSNFENNLANNSNLSIVRANSKNIIDSTNLNIINCNFINNVSDYGDGGAIYYNNFSGYTNLNIQKTNFENNTALNDGGAIFIETETDFKLTIDQSKFIKNKSAESGTGAIFYQAGYGPKGYKDINNISISNTLFARNSDAIAFNNGSYGTMPIDINNCTFFKNGKYIFGKSYNPLSDYIDNYAVMKIRNCAIWEPNSNIYYMFYNGDPKKTSISDFYVYNSIVNVSSLFVNVNADKGGVIYSRYPQFKDTLNNDFSLLPCSPAINKGNRYIIDSLGILYDLAGNPRIYQDSVDIGAYESQKECMVANQDLDSQEVFKLIPNLTYPNATIQLQINAANINDKYQIRIVDLSGKWIATYNADLQTTFDAPPNSGLYFVQLISENAIVGVAKLVVVE